MTNICSNTLEMTKVCTQDNKHTIIVVHNKELKYAPLGFDLCFCVTYHINTWPLADYL